MASPDGTLDVFAGLSSLVDKSLLRQDEGADGEPRFRMLETVREFGVERLEASGEGTDCRGRHARFFLALAERVGPEVTETGDPARLDVLERDHDNLRIALHGLKTWATTTRCCAWPAPCLFFWYYRGNLNEGQRWLSQALETPANAEAPRPRAWALTGAGCSPACAAKWTARSRC